MYFRTCPSGAQTKMQRVSFTEMSDKDLVGALLVGFKRCGALVGGQVVPLPVVLCVVVVAKMSGGAAPLPWFLLSRACVVPSVSISSHMPVHPACQG